MSTRTRPHQILIDADRIRAARRIWPQLSELDPALREWASSNVRVVRACIDYAIRSLGQDHEKNHEDR